MSKRPELSDLSASYDVIIIGGGINGAGILREAARTSLRVLLLEQGDFGSSTSSASSKLIHGGLRYLKTRQWRLTLESVRERRRLLREAPGLVEPQEFLMPIYRGSRPGKWTMRVGLWLYDLMAGQLSSRWLNAASVLACEPQLQAEGLLGGIQYQDAQTDDARLVLRLLFEAQRLGGADGRIQARNYSRVLRLLETDGRASGVSVEDRETGRAREIQAHLVIQATGAQTDTMTGAPPLRPLRGSHLLFPTARFPLGRAVGWLHPRDQRPIFAYPWQGASLLGTTDLDHPDELQAPRMSGPECEYLLEGVAHQFPNLNLSARDALSSYAGVRPVIAGGKNDPSAESRESALWSTPGLVGIAGGKLTTFRVTAREVLREAAKQLPALLPARESGLFPVTAGVGQDRVGARLGGFREQFFDQMSQADRDTPIGRGLSVADLRWSARHEQVVHLDDLVLRRSRLGLTEPLGAQALLPKLRALCQSELGWDDAKWNSEQKRYVDLWQQQHSPVSAT